MKNPLLLLAGTLTACATTPAPTAKTPTDELGACDNVASREVRFDVVGKRAAFVQAFLAAPLERFIKGTKALPGVDHTEALTQNHYPAVGSVRLVVLRDGQTAHEEVIAQDERTLRYVVTKYTSEAARPVAWGMGEFTFEPAGDKTHVTWRYSFALRRDRFPGSLGAIGRALFRAGFLDADYGPFMDAQVLEIQDFAAREVAR